MRMSAAAVLVSFTCPHAWGQGPIGDPDKSGYTLLNPTPRELRRPMSADRPDTTESPYTVDAGAVQLELSFADYTREGGEEAWAVAPVNLKLGLLNDVDLQLVFGPYIRTAEHEGIGDIQVRLKVNLWGNDGGGTAIAIMPFVLIPTSAEGVGSERVEGGVILPFAVDLAEGVGLGLMFETDVVHDAEGGDYDAEFVGTAVVGFDVSEEIGCYVEGVGVWGADAGSEFQGVLGLGATYAITPDLALDAGVNFGLTGAADDLNLFSGLTVRF